MTNLKINTKEKIINTSRLLFSINGFADTSMRKIAKEVGIKESTIYNYFSCKDDIINEIIDDFIILNEPFENENLNFSETIDKTTIRSWVNCISLFFDRLDLEKSKQLVKIVTNERVYQYDFAQYLEEFRNTQYKVMSEIIKKSCFARNISISDEDINCVTLITLSALINYYHIFSELESHDEIYALQEYIIDLILYLVKKI